MLLKADASKFKLGVMWWFLEPLMWVGVFYIVFSLILDNGAKSGDFILFLATGKFAFIWFSKTVIQASGSIVASQGLIGKVNMPKWIWPLSAIQESLYRQGSVYLLLIMLLGVFGIYPSVSWFMMIPVMLGMYLLIVACGLIGACLVCIVRDFMKFIPLGMTFLLFTSGIFWDVHEIPNQEKAQMLLTFNPLAFMIDAHRQVLLNSASPDMSHLLVLALVCLALIVLTIAYMQRYTHYLALKVLT
ncbi:ABC transporter [Halioglobus maricola]|uniref:Transport permease protein n=2 Tax=Halioglobus maricola TaxID=2601894 RepID=A0A5P9NPH3_9GAMM|nr:ABC transporter [Halioglobus maricola]